MVMSTSALVRALVAACAAVLLVGAGYAGQAGGSKPTDFDPKKKDAWRFLDDDLDGIRIEGGKAQQRGDYRTAARHYLAVPLSGTAATCGSSTRWPGATPAWAMPTAPSSC